MKRADGPVFIGGDGRSGTTLLSLVLDSHPEMVVGPELHFNGPENLGPYALQCVQLLIEEDPRAFGRGLKENPEFKLGVQFAKRCHRFGVPFPTLAEMINEAMERTNSDLTSFQERCVLIDLIGEFNCRLHSKPTWGIKIMREIGRLERYVDFWPSAKFVHIIRDGRDVTASQLNGRGTWGYADISVAARSWTGLIEDVRARQGANLLEIRYEDLITAPRRTTEQIATFLDVRWHASMLEHSSTDHTFFDNPYNHPSLATAQRPINDSAVGRYVDDLSIGQVEQFESIAGDTLRELGYQLSSGTQ